MNSDFDVKSVDSYCDVCECEVRALLIVDDQGATLHCPHCPNEWEAE